ncbi:MAG TPA: LptE family protein [Bacteroidota bacterium]|nr:LptE family protein [Bacteroidota bacterium]
MAVRCVMMCALVAVVAGCYSFTGASVPSHLRTIAIPLMDDQSGSGEAGLREKMTQVLTDLFIRDNSLEIADRATADSILEGVILPLRDEIVAVGGGESVNRRRLTLSVKVVYQDMKLRKKVYEKTFTNYGDYDPSGGFAQRQAAFDEAIRKISEDILLETVSGW